MKYSFYLYTGFILTGLIFLGAVQVLAQDRNKKTAKQIEALMKEKESRTPVQQKIDSQLLQAIRESSGKKMADGVSLEPANVYADKNGDLHVDISATVTDELLNNIKALGGQIIFPSKQYNTIRAQVPISKVETIAAYEQVKFIQPAVLPIHGGAAGNKAATQGNTMKPLRTPPPKGVSDTLH